MVQIGVKLDKRKRKKDGTFPLKISVHRNGKTLYIPLNISLHEDEWNAKKEEIEENLAKGLPYVIRQKMPVTGETKFVDAVFGEITVDNCDFINNTALNYGGAISAYSASSYITNSPFTFIGTT